MRLLLSSASIMLFLNILQDQQEYSGVAAMNVTANSSDGLGGDTVDKTSNSSNEGSDQSCNCSCVSKEERSLTVGGGLGLAAGTAILIFAFSNTVIIAATLVITYILYHVLITAVSVLAPGLALVMAKFLAVFTF